MPEERNLFNKQLTISSMGDSAKHDHEMGLPGSSVEFFVGESEQRREMPARLQERLISRPVSSKSPEEKRREQEQRKKELDNQKQQKLREHHEKVERLSAQKRERKKLQDERLARDQLKDYESDLKNPTVTQQREGDDQPRTQG
ncbi:hypothetical protein CRM22_002120 [Opisthorchis felineus]|uniref:Uncharacterized protein n=1 Tax=Opisthorchis felineus TaxID=147828 RepID=A0A4S2MDW5_OPIFE|nr:hypothetical protein CRM22_002120 [Opisthorchis felineus]